MTGTTKSTVLSHCIDTHIPLAFMRLYIYIAVTNEAPTSLHSLYLYRPSNLAVEFAGTPGVFHAEAEATLI
jgi:hypothetical protein